MQLVYSNTQGQHGMACMHVGAWKGRRGARAAALQHKPPAQHWRPALPGGQQEGVNMPGLDSWMDQGWGGCDLTWLAWPPLLAHRAGEQQSHRWAVRPLGSPVSSRLPGPLPWWHGPWLAQGSKGLRGSGPAGSSWVGGSTTRALDFLNRPRLPAAEE